jgi:predicted phage terminase large subunit-like protein
MIHLAPNEYRILLRRDPMAFLHRVFLHLHPTQAFLGNWHLDAIIAKIEECRLGKCRRLIINVPPRSLKSIMTSVAFPAWVLGHDPAKQFMCVSYAQDLADKHARDCRSVLTSDWYQKLFPAMRLSGQRQAVAEFVTTLNGFRIATSVGGVITGLGADVIIIDDPLRPEEALSETLRKAANEWIGHTLYSRLNDKRSGVIIIVMQRLHEDDLVGHLQRQTGEKWDILNFPAIAEQPQTFVWQTPLGRFERHRAVGDVLHPEREPLAELEVLRARLGEYHFACQYQQNPAPLGGGMVKDEWFKRYRDPPEKFDRVIQSWDTANKPTELSDYSVCVTLGVIGNRNYLLNVWRKKVGYPDLKRAVRQQYDQFRPNVVLIEDRASGTQLVQELREAGLSAVTPYKSGVDKIMRFDAQTATIENGLFLVPEEAHWLAEYLHELKTFPKARYDDQVDATAQALEWLKKPWPGFGIFEYMRLEAEKAMSTSGPGRPDFGFEFANNTAARQPTIRLRVLQPVSHIYTIVGRRILVPRDRVIEVTEEEAQSLLCNGIGVKVQD